MKHTERMELAHDLCAKLLERYPGQVILCGLYGSTSNGADTPWSDLELIFIVEDGCPAQGQHLIVRGTAVSYRVYRRSELEAILSAPSLRWPFHMGLISEMRVLYGNPDQVRGWLEMGKSIPRARFHEALATLLPELVVESHGRIHTSIQRGDLETLRPVVLEVLFEMNIALCLLNQRWVTHDYYQGLVDSFTFEKLPEGYTELVPALYANNDSDKIVSLADTLVAHFWRLMEQEGIQVRDHRSVGEIAV